MQQPFLFNGALLHPFKFCLLSKAMPVAPDSGKRLSMHRDKNLKTSGLELSQIESVVVYKATSKVSPVWLLTDNDDFMLL